MQISDHARLVFLGICFAGLAACGVTHTQSSRFYLLSSLPNGATVNIGGAQARSLKVGPIEVADYLHRAEIVTRTDDNSLVLADFHRWAGRLEDNITTVIEEDLASLLAAEGYIIHPWDAPMKSDYRVTLEITRFDGNLDGEVVLQGTWHLFAENMETPIASRRINLSLSTNATGYKALVATQSQILADLCRRIADVLMSADQ